MLNVGTQVKFIFLDAAIYNYIYIYSVVTMAIVAYKCTFETMNL